MKINRTRYIFEDNDLIDTQTGDTIDFKKCKRITMSTYKDDNFIHLYTSSLKDFPTDLTHSEQKLMNYLLRKLGYMNSSKRSMKIGGSFRQGIMKELGFKTDTMNKAVSSLYKKELVIKLKNNNIMLNPKFFARGNGHDIVAIKQIIVQSGNEYTQITELGVRRKKPNEN